MISSFDYRILGYPHLYVKAKYLCLGTSTAYGAPPGRAVYVRPVFQALTEECYETFSVVIRYRYSPTMSYFLYYAPLVMFFKKIYR